MRRFHLRVSSIRHQTSCSSWPYAVARFLIPAHAQEEAMSHENSLTRREFTVQSALAMLAGITITISGCGDDVNPAPAPSPTPTDRTGTVSTDAGHSHTGASSRRLSLRLECDYVDPFGNRHTYAHGNPLSSRAHASQRGDTRAKDVVERQRAHAHRDVQLNGIRDPGIRDPRSTVHGLARRCPSDCWQT